ncbi:nucleotidyltransferase family protein [Larkinella soli]|uniref:nucleotidyltransferase family protein n=1 Tax=Larkinella soli TaxID=1770527 RepID=UPI000FFC3755|nr:nucleotidyltransferase domain-containing protein [Larkinella soli]
MESIRNFQTFQDYLREKQVFDRFGLSRIGVFGSFARGEAFRDIDLLIEDDVPYKKLIQLRDDLQQDLGVQVDIMLKPFAEPIILNRALKDIRYATRQ